MLTHNDILRLKRFLRRKHYWDSVVAGYDLVYLPKKKKYRLALLLSDARWKRLSQLLKMRKIQHLPKEVIELIFEPETII